MDFITSIQVPPVTDNSLFEDIEGDLFNEGLEAGKVAEVSQGQYDNLTWQNTEGLQDETATEWGTKTLPGAGPFYFANHEDGNPTIGHLDTTDDVGV